MLVFYSDYIFFLEENLAKYIVKKSDPLIGEVTISGAKNSVLPLMAATLLTEEETIIMDAPALKDVEIMCNILRSVGAKVVDYLESNVVEINAKEILTEEVPFDLVGKMRASILVLGPLLARQGKAKIALPGGCAIGDRPIELHIKGLTALGATIKENKDGWLDCKANKLVGATIYLDFPSVGATENLIMAASMAEGVTIIENAAQEPEIVDLANFINKMGGKVRGAGTDIIKIEGVSKLKGAKHNVIPDRIEAGTFMIAAAITRGEIMVKNVLPEHMRPIIAKLRECGIEIEEYEDTIIVRASGNKKLLSTDIKTLPYPGFPTDMQAQFMAFLTTVDGPSVVIESVFENRYMHVKELEKMGAKLRVQDRSAIIEGKKKLKGAKVDATDLRAGAAVVLAGFVAEGETEVSEIYHIERGYEKFVEKFRSLGGNIEKVDE